VKGKRIALKEVLNTMEARDGNGFPIPFSCVVVSFNKQKNTGGQFLEFSDVVLATTQVGEAYSTAMAAKAKGETFNLSAETRLTRLVKFLVSGEVRKINFRLMVQFNNMKVVW
jgi:hypothetical protein